MMADLTSGIVRVLRPDKETAGTGFVVAEDLVVTCAHVIPLAAQPKDGRACTDGELVFRADGRCGPGVMAARRCRGCGIPPAKGAPAGGSGLSPGLVPRR